MLAIVIVLLCAGTILFAILGWIPIRRRSSDTTLRPELSLSPFSTPRIKEIDYTEEEVREFLKIGVERSAISARFGEPISEAMKPDGGGVLIYHRPFRVRGDKEAPQAFHFTGFSVYLRDNKLVTWEPITGNSSVPQ